ncbi:MAG: hypothetical protein J6T94_04610 [Bacteroidaceae bacterium]|nr:hypothetical protein [Bacteroidaceae bacterium]
MKKRFLLISMAALMAAPAVVNAQDDGEYIDLLPEGVTANVNPERKADKQKNIVVAGSPEKGYYAFFAATDAAHGEELWVTDGTTEGTHMVKDIVPGTGSSNPSYLGRLNDKVLFSAYTEDAGQETWVSDGTEEGTFMLVDSYTFGDGDPKGFIQMDETRAVFGAYDDESVDWDPENGPQQWLWITDGTVAGTKRVVENGNSKHQAKVNFPGQDHTTLHHAYIRVGRRVYFKGDQTDLMTGEELWVTDGTEEGTYLVMDINWEKGAIEGQTRNCGLDNLENFNNEKCFFQAWTPDFGGEPWVTDGTPGAAVQPGGEGDEHTFMIKDTKPGKDANGIGYHAGTFGTGWEVYQGRIWWRGYDPRYGYEISGSNMTKGDYIIYDIWQEEPSVDHNSYSDPGCIFDGVYMYCAAHGFDAARSDNYGGELWCLDSEKETDQVWLLCDFFPSINSNWVKEQVVAGGSLYWMNESNEMWAEGRGTGLYRLDSKTSMPVCCPHIDPSAASTGDMVNTLRNLDGTIIFASDATHRVYCYKYTKEGWDGVSDMGYLEPEYRTPAEIAEDEAKVKEVLNDAEPETTNVFNMAGVLVRRNVATDDAQNGLPQGMYVVGGKKVIVK